MASNKESSYHYQVLQDNDQESGLHSTSSSLPQSRSLLYRLKTGIICSLLIIAVAIGSFALGYKYNGIQHQQYDLESSVPLERIIINQGPNRTYLERSTPQNEALWSDLYPSDGHGVFLDAVDGDKIVGFAAFHELHCVHTLLKRHYQAEDIKQAYLNSAPMPVFESEITHRHTLHCIELLRQATLCHADTTMQFESVIGKGVPAFNTPYQCRSWQQLVDYVDRMNIERGPYEHREHHMDHSHTV